ncbi:MAG: T9SS type A sorting domain-containing protein [Saprospiraceae bacterium]|nr:MAG: T9SS type A sorting domain-containing protein [Saprospiraceae bacterium]
MYHKKLITTHRRSGSLVKHAASLLYFSLLFFSFSGRVNAQLDCSDYSQVSFQATGNPASNTCSTDRFTYFFYDQTQNAGPTFDAHQIYIELKISGDGEFDQSMMAALLEAHTPSSSGFEYGAGFPDEQTFRLLAYCSSNPWDVPFGSANDPFMEAVVIPTPGGAYSLNSTVKVWVSPVTNCSEECILSSTDIPAQADDTPACAAGLVLDFYIEGHTPVNGKYTIDPHEEVTAYLTLTNTGTASLDIADFDLKLSLDDLHGTLPLPAPNSGDWLEFFIEATNPVGAPAYETHGSPFHYFQYGTLNQTTLQPNVPVEMLAFSIAPPEELENILGELFAKVEYARMVDGNGNCCELDASNVNLTVKFPGTLPCDPNKAIKFSMEPATGFDDCETGFEVLATLTGPMGPIQSIDLTGLQVEFSTVSTNNLEITEVTGGPAGVVAAFDCTNTGNGQECTVTLSYPGGIPFTLSNGDTWRVVFRGSDATQIEAVDFTSAAVRLNGSSEDCVPVTDDDALLPYLPIKNVCEHCLDYTIEIGHYGGGGTIGQCQAGFSVYLNAPDMGSSATQITVGLDFQNPGGLTISASGNPAFCYPFGNTCPPVPGNCVAVNGSNITYSLCLGGIGLSNPPVRLFDVVIEGDGCLTDMIFNMQTMIHPTGGDPCMPMDVSTSHEVCTANCTPSEYVFSGNIHALNNSELPYDIEVPIEPPGSGVTSTIDAGIKIVSGPVNDVCDVLTGTLPPIGVDCNGNYEVTVPCDNPNEGGQFTITPKKDTEPLNGVTTFDLVLITRQILGIQPLASPYKLIAADANGNGAVTTFDLVEIRKLILFIITKFSNNTSWRFIDANYQFPNPSNPWAEPFPEIINLTFSGQNNSATGLDFVGVKIGDVNGSAKCDDDLLFTNGTDDRDNGVKMKVNAHGKGAVNTHIVVDFAAEWATPLAAWQLGLWFDPEYLSLEEALPDTGLDGMNAGSFGTTEAGGGKLRAIWFSPYGLAERFDGRRNFRLRFRVLRPFGDLTEVIRLDDTVLPNRAYEGDGTAHNIQLEAAAGALPEFALPPVNEIYVEAIPNPFGDKLTFTVQSAQPEEFEIRVMDVYGRLMTQQSGKAAFGQTALIFDDTDAWGSGVFLWQLSTARQVLTGRLIKE